MKSKQLFNLVLILSFSFLFFNFSQPNIDIKSLDDKIPTDPKIKIGTLSNGMKYYIKYNKKPEKRAELMLVVNAGAICEDPNQNGLAHFCEHMAFNGTKNFPKQALIDYLESIGVKFGPELNAFTSWDETVYMLQIPTDSIEQFVKGFQVLEDWAHNVTFDPTEIDKERGVVIEEYRLGRGADERVERKHNKLLFYNSKYAIHDIIGDTNILRNASYDVIKKFYRDWYRPDLMAIIAVGDFDVGIVEKIIKEKFSRINKPSKIRKREYVVIPPHKEVFVSIASDKELSFPRVEINFKGDEIKEGTFRNYRENLLSRIYTTMLNYRLNEYLRKENPPFKFFVYSSYQPLGRKNSSFVLFAGAIGNAVDRCVETLLMEAFRAYQHGFTITEFERAKKEILRQYESMYNERDKTESINFAFEFMRNFLSGEAIPGIEFEYELVKKWMPDIKLEEVNALSNKFIKKENALIAISLPERQDVVVPKEEDIKKMFADISNKKLEPYVDVVPTKPLFNKNVSEGKIIQEKELKNFDALELKLSNGATVVLKKTDFKDDEVIFAAYSLGGASLVKDEDYFNATYADNIISESGLGQFNKTELDKYLADKVVKLWAGISDYSEYISGSSSPKDLKTLFEMINLTFTEPRIDKEAFSAQKQQLIANIKDSRNRPEKVFGDSIRCYLWNWHPRTLPITESDVEKFNMNKMYEIFTERYSDPSDFIFFFVGNFNIDTIKNYVKKYIGSIPGNNIKETWKDVGIEPFKNRIEKQFKKGIEKKSFVRLILTGPFDWSLRERFLVRALNEVLDIRLREVLREEKGGTYGVAVWFQTNPFPKKWFTLNITFGCNPERVEELTKDAVSVLTDIATNRQKDIYLTKVKEILRRELELDKKDNNFWVSKLYDYYFYNDPENVVDIWKDYIESLSLDDIFQTAKKYIKFDNFAKFVLYPEDQH
ncbi:MAG: insulinase family protein [Ignavibacteria bacterium]|nr:insulinase family protein [Ignavibacteria bacterium]